MTLTIIRGNGETGAAGSAAGAGGRVQNAIASASASTGVDFKYLYKQAGIESGYNANARATTSSASGLYQFTNQTWLGVIKNHGAEHGLSWAANAITRDANGHYSVSDETTKQEILALRQSPETSAAMAGEYAADNKSILQAKLGRDANSTDLYMAHFLGPAGATRFLKAKDADPDQSAASVMPAAARANKWVFYDKSGNPRSLADVYQRFAARFDQSSLASTGTSATTVQMAGATDTAADIARMQFAALNGTSDGTTVSTATALNGGLNGALNGTTTNDPTNMTAAAVLSPSPQTARLAYLMLASLGV